MAGKTKPMSQIKQIFRLHQQGHSKKAIARTCDISRNTVKRYLQWLHLSEWSVAQVLDLEDPVLEHMLHNTARPVANDARYAHWITQAEMYLAELNKKGVTRWLLWDEYRQEHPQGYSYSQFCWHLQQFTRSKEVTLKIHHKPGEKLFIDFAGAPLQWIDRDSGEVYKAQVFVASLPYSSYSFVRAVRSQKAGDFLSALVECLNFFGGSPQLLVPDNLKSAVTRPDRYEPDINRLMEDLANHYGIALLPARSSKPKDKGAVENHVKIAYSHVYARLRNQQFFSLRQLNQAIDLQVEQLNEKLFQGKDHSRKDLFETQEKAALVPLPTDPYEIKKYRQYTVQKNCHIHLTEDRHNYSVPYAYIGQKVKVVYTPSVVNIYCQGERIACHQRNYKKHDYTTVRDHLPSHHNHWLDRSPQYYQKWASGIASEALELTDHILQSKRHVEQAYRSCEGLKALVRRHGKELFIQACRKALELQCYNYAFVKRLLNNGMIHQQSEEPKPLPEHNNVRGSKYYQHLLNLK